MLTEDGAFALFFRPHPGGFEAQESPPLGICHPRQKMLMPGDQPGGGGGGGGEGEGWAQLELTDALLEGGVYFEITFLKSFSNKYYVL